MFTPVRAPGVLDDEIVDTCLCAPAYDECCMVESSATTAVVVDSASVMLEGPSVGFKLDHNRTCVERVNNVPGLVSRDQLAARDLHTAEVLLIIALFLSSCIGIVVGLFDQMVERVVKGTCDGATPTGALLCSAVDNLLW